MKKTIVHIIDNMGRGGAETMLVSVIKQLDEYNNIIVTLYPVNEFGDELKCDKYYCLNLRSPLFIPQAALQLKKIIAENNVCLVHSHLFWSTVVARLGVPKKIPLITTIHAFVASSIEYRPWKMRIVEKLTYKIRKSTIIAVAKGALDEYFSFLNISPHKAYALYTFVDPAIFNKVKSIEKKDGNGVLRVITVGNLKEQKNHQFLLEVFKNLKDQNISLDIYGKGPLEQSLQKMIDENNLNVTLKGQVTDIAQRIADYDLFVMSSLYEGFALSVLEAMALGMPLMLSNIVSFKEQCADTAVYYKLNDENDFVSKLLALKNDKVQMGLLGAAAKKRVLENYTLNQHMQQLKKVYTATLQNN